MQKYIFSILLLLGFGIVTVLGQNFYDQNTLQKIEITFAQPNWDYMMDTAKAGSEGFILASTVTVNGIIFDSVGVKYKGNSSYNANNTKNPLHIELDYIHGNADYQGYTDIKLSNGKSDPSFIREVLSYEILRDYMHAPLANWAQVYINDQEYGLYTNVESINKDFIDNHFQVTDKTIVKCNPKNAGPGGSTSSLVSLGSDSTSYYNNYEIKSDFGWANLLNLIDTLNNQPAQLDKIMDIDRAIWMLGFSNVLVHLDSYSGAFAQNYYLAMDNNHRFNSIIWDLNMSFGAFTMTGTGGPLSVAQMQSLTPLLHETNAARPLIKNILANPMYKKMYIAHMKTITNEHFGNGDYLTRAQTLMSIVDTAVNSDPYKFYSYLNFQNSLTTTITGGMSIPGIQLLMDARATYLNGTTEFSQVPPTISNIANTTATINSNVYITANITSLTYTYLGYRYAITDKFTYVQMYDDGTHQDGVAGDGVFGASFMMSAPVVQYYIYAENANAGIFSPERAEYEFYTLQAAASPIAYHDVVINEFMASNGSTVTDPTGEYADWIELYNNTGSSIDMSGIYLSDDTANLQKWYFPWGTVIPANGFLIVWADQDLLETDIHSNFKLSSSGETLILSNTNGAILDSVSYSAATVDISYERYPNGTGPFADMAPTFNSMNYATAIESGTTEQTLRVYPNPTNDIIFISFGENNQVTDLQLFNTMGEVVAKVSHNQEATLTLTLGELPIGVYYLRSNTGEVHKIIKE